MHVSFGYTAALFFPSLLEFGETFFVSAGADKHTVIPFSDHFHPLMADRTSRVRCAGYGFAVSAGTILAHQKFRVLSIDGKKIGSGEVGPVTRKIQEHYAHLMKDGLA